MIKKALLLLLVLAPLWAACSKGPTGAPQKKGNDKGNTEVLYSDPQRSFSCAIPGSWGVDETEAGGIYSTVDFHDPGQTSTIRVERYVEGTLSGNDTPRQYIHNRQLEAMEPGINGYFHEKPSPLKNENGFHFVTVESVPRMDQSWNGKREAYETKTTSLRDEEVVLPDAGGFYVIAYICNPKINCNQESVFQNVVKTFKIQGDDPNGKTKAAAP